MTVVIIYSPTLSGWFIFAVFSFVHPIVPFVEVLSTASLWVTTSCIGFITVLSQRGLTVLGMVTDIGSVGVAVMLNLSPCGLVGAWCVGVWWCTCAVGTVSYVTRLD